MANGTQDAEASEARTARRRGSRASETRTRLLDAAAEILVEEGGDALTARRVGERAGVKFQLVHYYFTSMDDLVLELFRRGAQHSLSEFARVSGENLSVQSLWGVTAEAYGGRQMAEFYAMANHRPMLKQEIAQHIRRFRAAQLEVARAALAAHAPNHPAPPEIVLLLATGLAQLVTQDVMFGVTEGHDETIAWFEKWLSSGG
ncbi:MAG: TetR/AcrR family transcriptional regulator [Marmoricola sp.]